MRRFARRLHRRDGRDDRGGGGIGLHDETPRGGDHLVEVRGAAEADGQRRALTSVIMAIYDWGEQWAPGNDEAAASSG